MSVSRNKKLADGFENMQGGRAMLYIGVDLGTSAVKLLLMDENGNIIYG